MRAALSTGGRQDLPTLEEQALYHNLCILGIVSPSLKQEGIELGRTTFRRSNNKALEYVLYRLYSIIEGKSRAQKDFKGMLPVLDKVQQAPFYQRIGDWMMELKKAGRLEPSVILPVSALKTNTSNRLILLLLEISTVALQQDIETTCPGSTQAAFLPPAGSSGAGGGMGLLDDSLVPAEARLGVSVSRAKLSTSEFLTCVANTSSVSDTMEQHSLAFKKRYYELQAEIRQQSIALAALSHGSTAAAAGSSPHSALGGSPTSLTFTRTGSGVLLGPAAAAGAGAGDSTLSDSASVAPEADQQSLPAAPRVGRPDPESLAALSSLLAGLDEHLRVHMELEKALLTESAAAGAGGGAVEGGLANGGFRFGQPAHQQMLHPYQIDGRVLAAAAADVQAAQAAAEAAAARGATAGFEQQQLQRRLQQQNGRSCGPDNIAMAVGQFQINVMKLAPQLQKLAGLGDTPGPPPLLQPPSHPNSHAAHVAHQLQVHTKTSRQIAQLSRKVQEQAVNFGPVLRALRAESNRVISQRWDLSGHDSLDDDFLDVGPHLALPPALAPPARQGNFFLSSSPKLDQGPAPPSSSAAPSTVVMGSPCPSSASAFLAASAAASADMASGAGASASAGAGAAVLCSSGMMVAGSTAVAPMEAGSGRGGIASDGEPEDAFAQLQARLHSLKVGASSHTAAAAAAAKAVGVSGGVATVSVAPPTSARAVGGAGMANNTGLGMLSPSAMLSGIGPSPMAMSGPGAAAAARSPLFASVKPLYPDFAMAGGGMAAASPLRGMQSMQEAPLGFEGVRFRQQQSQQDFRAAQAGPNAPGAAATASSGNSAAWTPMSWIGAAASAAPHRANRVSAQPAAAGTASQAGPGNAGQQLYSRATQGWMQPTPPSEASPPSRRTLAPQFLQQQQQLHLQQQHPQGAAVAPSPPFGGSLPGGAFGQSESSGGTTAAVHHQQQQQQRMGTEALRPAAATGVDASRGGVCPTGWDACSGAYSAGAPFGCAAVTVARLAQAESTSFAAGSGRGDCSGAQASSENRKVDLGSLIDDDEDDRGGGQYLASNRGENVSAHGAVGFEGLTAAFPSLTAFAAMAQPEADLAVLASSVSGNSAFGAFHSLDADTDFGLLAAEGELVSQALMLFDAAAPSYNAPEPAAAAATGPFGAPADGGGSACGGPFSSGTPDGGGSDRSFVPVAGGAGGTAASVAHQAAFDVDNGDDVVMADNDKDVTSGLGGKGASAAGWLAAGPTAAVTAAAVQGTHAKAGLFDAFSVLLSPEQAGGPGRPQHGSVTEPAGGTFGADILALKARMQAISKK